MRIVILIISFFMLISINGFCGEISHEGDDFITRYVSEPGQTIKDILTWNLLDYDQMNIDPRSLRQF